MDSFVNKVYAYLMDAVNVSHPKDAIQMEDAFDY